MTGDWLASSSITVQDQVSVPKKVRALLKGYKKGERLHWWLEKDGTISVSSQKITK